MMRCDIHLIWWDFSYSSIRLPCGPQDKVKLQSACLLTAPLSDLSNDSLRSSRTLSTQGVGHGVDVFGSGNWSLTDGCGSSPSQYCWLVLVVLQFLYWLGSPCLYCVSALFWHGSVGGQVRSTLLWLKDLLLTYVQSVELETVLRLQTV